MDPPLTPSLWRTCRVIASGTRLRLLEVLRRSGKDCVSDLARDAGLSRVTATQNLRALQARGLVRAVRAGRWVYYDLHPDPLVRHAGDILAAVLAALRRRDDEVRIVQAATAFTHERRIRLAQALSVKAGRPDDLARRCGMSLDAAYRHLDKLARRGLAAVDADGVWQLVQPPPGLARDLLRIVLNNRQGA